MTTNDPGTNTEHYQQGFYEWVTDASVAEESANLGALADQYVDLLNELDEAEERVKALKAALEAKEQRLILKVALEGLAQVRSTRGRLIKVGSEWSVFPNKDAGGKPAVIQALKDLDIRVVRDGVAVPIVAEDYNFTTLQAWVRAQLKDDATLPQRLTEVLAITSKKKVSVFNNKK